MSHCHSVPHSRLTDDDPEARCREFLDRMPVGLFRTTPDGQFLDANPALARTLGYPDREAFLAAYANAADLYANPDERRQWQALVERDEVVLQFETQWRRLDGTVIWVEENARLVRDAEGRTFYEGSAQDVTGRKQRETHLRLAEAKYRSLVEQVPAAIYIHAFDEAASTIYISPQVEAMLGYSPAEWQTETGLWARLLHPDDREEAVAENARHVATGEPFKLEYRLVGRSGQVVWIRDEAVIVRDESGRPLVSQGVMLDVTERKRAEEELLARERHLTLLNTITRAALTTSGLQATLQVLADHLGELLHADDCSISLWDEAMQAPIPAAASLELREVDAAIQLDPDEVTLTASVLRAGHALAVEDVFNTPYISPRLAALFSARSILGLPLIAAEQKLGAAVIAFNQPHHFTPDEIARGEQAAGQVALAVARAQSFEATQRQLEELTALHAVANAGAEATSEDALIERVMQIIGETIYPDNFGVLLLDEAAGVLRVHPSYRTRTRAKGWGPAERVRLGQGIVGHVAATGRSWRVPAQRVSRERGYVMIDPDMRSELCVPLKTGERVIGVINAESRLLGAFSEADERLMTTLAGQMATAIEKARLFAETIEALTREQRLNGVARVISGALDLATILQSVVRLAAELVSAEAGSLALLAPGGDSLSFGYVFNLPEEYNQQRIPKGAGIAWQIIGAGESVLLADYGAHPEALPALVAAGVRGFLGVPLVAGDDRLGALGLFHLSAETRFTERDRALAESVGRQAGVAIQNARLFETERRRVQALTALHEISLDLSAQFRPLVVPVLLHTIVERAARLLDATAGALFLLEPDGRTLEQVVSYNLSRDFTGTRLRLGEGLAGRIAQTGEPLVVGSYHEWPYRAAAYADVSLGAAVGVPIKWQGRVIGTLNIADERPDRFGPAEVELMSLFADQAAVAIENARLYTSAQQELAERKRAQDQLEQSARQLTSLSHMGQTVAASLDLTEVLEHVIEEVSAILGAEGVSILLLDAGRPDELVFAAVQGVGTVGLPGQRMPATAGVAGEVVRTGHSLLVSGDEGQAQIYREIERVSGYHTQALVAVPLKLDDEVIGVMEAVHTRHDAFGAVAPRLLEAAANWAAIAIGNARRHENIQRHLQESQAMAAISRALNETLDLGRVLQLIVNSARQIMPNVVQAVIHLLDEERQALRPAAVAGLRAELGEPDLTMRPGEGIAGRVIAEGSLINVSDVQADPRYLPRGGATHLRSLMVASVQSGTRRLGAISVQSAAPRAFSSEDERLLATLGAQAALAIENARFFEVERRRAEEAEALQHVTQTLISRLDLVEMLTAVVEAIATMANCQYVSVFLLEKDRLVLHSHRGYSRSAAGPYSVQLDEGIVGRVARTGLPTLVPDVMKQDEDYQARDSVPRGAVQSAIGVPLIHAGRTLGVLLIESRADPPARRLDDGDLRWLANVGRQLSVAIENTRLYADLEEALQQEKATRARLVQSEKLAAMGRLVASVAHELNNPLQAIQNALYLVRQDSHLGTQAREDLQVALTEADRMAGLVGRLRESYRSTAVQEFRPESLDTVVEEVRRLIGTHLRHNNVTFEFDPDPALPAVAGIHDQLKQVFLNLCLNAVEAMPGGGRLTIEMRHQPEAGQVLVTVADTGIGIDPAALPNVFDPFYTTKAGGTGLGLAITYDIIQRHNGHVDVESQPGPEGGTVFKVWLPAGQ